MKSCIFCKISKKEISSKIVYENKNVFSFLDNNPYNLGHTLVIPKKHYRWVWDIKEIDQFFNSISKVANAMKKGLETDYIVSLIFGEEVHHAHVHLVPRYENDGHGGAIDIHNHKKFPDKEELEAIKKIQRFL